jgi:uncharacterized membrane protein
VITLRRMRPIWWHVTNSLWFIPSLAVTGSVLLGVGLVELDARVEQPLGERWPRLFGAGYEGARGMLTAIASSMITVAGVVFSLTIVSLSLAASQYSPRVLRTFSSDRPTQVVLGAFVGIFAYCLVVLRTIRGGDDEADFVPSIAVLGGLVLALVGVGLLVYFIHHLAESIQAASILLRLSKATRKVIDDAFPESLGDSESAPRQAPTLPEPRTISRLAARASGYLVDVNMKGLVAFSRARGSIIRMDAGIGDFVISGQPLLSVQDDELTDAEATSLLACYTLDRQRTIEQDPGFGIQQIVDVGSKALSAGINDASTAMLCVDRLTEILSQLAPRRISPVLRDEHGPLGVIVKGPSFAMFVDLAYHTLRNDALAKPLVIMRLIWSNGCVGAVTHEVSRRRVLAEQARCIANQARQADDVTGDFADIFARALELDATLRPADEPPATAHGVHR